MLVELLAGEWRDPHIPLSSLAPGHPSQSSKSDELSFSFTQTCLLGGDRADAGCRMLMMYGLILRWKEMRAEIF